ncbi:DUF6000 family protein [Streptomyces sp. NPDC006551]|uniref:DUF6000 family protein n=1 Tax=Streptomyces sp. NPDC006551 TaxID=3157178 RepID=UPI0033A2FEF0
MPTASPWPASARTRTPRSSPPTSTATSPRTDLHYDQPAALGALLRLDALLGTHHADRFTEPDGLWDEWVKGVGRLGYPSHTPAEQRRWTDLQCDFTNGWSRA